MNEHLLFCAATRNGGGNVSSEMQREKMQSYAFFPHTFPSTAAGLFPLRGLEARPNLFNKIDCSAAPFKNNLHIIYEGLFFSMFQSL